MSRRGLVLLCLAGCVAFASGCGCRRKPTPPPTRVGAERPRIVSLAPATTEALFALGLGDHVVGVSRFCDYPPDVAGLARVGGLTDVDIEAIVRLLPDLVVAPVSQLRARETLAKLNIAVLTVEQDTLPQILDSMWRIGEALDRADVAAAWLAEMEQLFATVKEHAPQGEARPRVLVCVGRDTASLERLYIAGRGSFYAEILELVGARNAYTGDAPYPIVSAEGVVRMNPDLILDIIPAGPDGPRLSDDDAQAQWAALPGIRAVAEGKVHVLTETWAVRPGPRIGFLIERVARIVQQSR